MWDWNNVYRNTPVHKITTLLSRPQTFLRTSSSRSQGKSGDEAMAAAKTYLAGLTHLSQLVVHSQ